MVDSSLVFPGLVSLCVSPEFPRAKGVKRGARSRLIFEFQSTPTAGIKAESGVEMDSTGGKHARNLGGGCFVRDDRGFL